MENVIFSSVKGKETWLYGRKYNFIKVLGQEKAMERKALRKTSRTEADVCRL